MLIALDMANKIRECREHKGFTQKQLAQYLGISQASMSAYEQGTATPPTEIVCKMSTIFDRSSDYLLGLDNHQRINVYGLTAKQYTIISEIKEAYIRKKR